MRCTDLTQYQPASKYIALSEDDVGGPPFPISVHSLTLSSTPPSNRTIVGKPPRQQIQKRDWGNWGALALVCCDFFQAYPRFDARGRDAPGRCEDWVLWPG